MKTHRLFCAVFGAFRLVAAAGETLVYNGDFEMFRGQITRMVAGARFELAASSL